MYSTNIFKIFLKILNTKWGSGLALWWVETRINSEIVPVAAGVQEVAVPVAEVDRMNCQKGHPAWGPGFTNMCQIRPGPTWEPLPSSVSFSLPVASIYP